MSYDYSKNMTYAVREKLRAIGKEMRELNNKRQALHDNAWKAIGCEEGGGIVDDDLKEAWADLDDEDDVYIEFFLKKIRKWNIEAAQRRLLRLTEEAGIQIEDLDWDEIEPEEEEA